MTLHDPIMDKFAVLAKTNLPPLLPHTLRVPKNASPALEALSKNLQALIDAQHPKMSMAALCKAAGLNDKAIKRMLKKEHEPSIDSIAAVAKVFGKEAWELIHPDGGVAGSDLPSAMRTVVGALNKLEGSRRVHAEERMRALIDLSDSQKGFDAAVSALDPLGGASYSSDEHNATGTHGR